MVFMRAEWIGIFILVSAVPSFGEVPVGLPASSSLVNSSSAQSSVGASEITLPIGGAVITLGRTLEVKGASGDYTVDAVAGTVTGPDGEQTKVTALGKNEFEISLSRKESDEKYTLQLAVTKLDGMTQLTFSYPEGRKEQKTYDSKNRVVKKEVTDQGVTQLAEISYPSDDTKIIRSFSSIEKNEQGTPAITQTMIRKRSDGGSEIETINPFNQKSGTTFGPQGEVIAQFVGETSCSLSVRNDSQDTLEEWTCQKAGKAISTESKRTDSMGHVIASQLITPNYQVTQNFNSEGRLQKSLTQTPLFTEKISIDLAGTITSETIENGKKIIRTRKQPGASNE